MEAPSDAQAPAPSRGDRDRTPGSAAEPSASFAAFYGDSYRRVAAGLSLALGDRDLGHEATDEAMVRALQRWEAVRAYDNPAGWVYRVGLNWGRSWRSRLRRANPVLGQAPVPPDDAVTEPAVATAIRTLEPRMRDVVVCRLLLDMSVQDTAVVLGIAEGTVKSRLHRAIAALRPQLEDLQ